MSSEQTVILVKSHVQFLIVALETIFWYSFSAGMRGTLSPANGAADKTTRHLKKRHTFLPNDRDFGVIEKFKKGQMAYVPEDYVKIIKYARTSCPFEVVTQTKDDVTDYMAFSKTHMKTTMLKDTESNETSQIRHIMWFSYGKSDEIEVNTGTKTVTNHYDEM